MRSNILLVTPGLRRDIFPWGVELLKDHLDATTSTRTEIIDLRKDEIISGLIDDAVRDFGRDFGPKVNSLYASLWSLAVEPDAALRDKILSILFVANEGLDRVLAARHLPRLTAAERALLPRVVEFARRVDERVVACVTRAIEPDCNLLGFSIYQVFNLMWALRLGQVLKQSLALPVVMGGSFFPYRRESTARSIIETQPWVDAVVLGPGAKALEHIVEGCGRGQPPRNLVAANVLTPAHPALDTNALPRLPGLEGGCPIRFETKAAHWSHPGESRPKIRIFDRIGCAWARCTFCEFHKETRFQNLTVTPHAKLVLDHVERLEREGSPVDIQVDSDDPNLGDWTRLLMVVADAMARRGNKVPFWAFSYIRPSLLKRQALVDLLTLRRRYPHFKYDVAVDIESINPKTLRTMNKGLSTLDAVARVKTMVDLDYRVFFFLFSFYPSEDLASSRIEYHVLRRVLHLFWAKQAGCFVSTYLAGDGQPLVAEAEKHRMVLKTDRDPVLKETFGVAFDFIKDEYEIDGRGMPQAGIIVNYKRLIDAVATLHIALRAKRWTPTAVGRVLWRASALTLRLARFLFFQLLRWDFAYAKKFVLLLLAHVGLLHGRAELSLRGSRLSKHYLRPYREHWDIDLSPLETRLLRFLYLPRGRAELEAAFAGEAEALAAALKRHKSLGSVVELEDRFLSLASMPDLEELQAVLAEG